MRELPRPDGFPGAAPCGPVLETAVATDTGCRREVNEDCVRLETPEDPALRASHGTLAVVADGMGGHDAGELASALAVETVSREYFRHPGPPWEALREAFARAHEAVRALSRTRANGMGTTCTAVAVHGGCASVAHIGDSRLYLVRGGAVFRMTEDHSAVMEQVRAGLISAGQARGHEDRNLLLRALGSPSSRVDVQPRPFPLRPGDILALSSDGLHGLVEDEELGAAVAAGTPQEACARLVALARQRGGYDNITVALLRYHAGNESEGGR